MQSITFDIGVAAAVVVLAAYSILIRKHKALATLLALYPAYFVAATWADSLTRYVSGDKIIWNNAWLQAKGTESAVQIVLFFLITIALSTFVKLGGRRARYSLVEVVAYVLCSSALALTFFILMLAPESRDALLTSSKIAPFLFQWREIILTVPLAVMLYFGIYKDEDSL